MRKKSKKLWYIIRHKSKERWAAYELQENQIDNLQPGYEFKGPFGSMLKAMIAANA